MKLDWIDSILFSLSFVAWIAFVTFLQRVVGVHPDSATSLNEIFAIPAMLSLVALRRLVYGMPRLPEPKQGLLWSLMSVLGLFFTLAGAASLFFAGRAASFVMSKPKDFMKESRAFHAKLTDFSKVFPKIQYPNETRQQFRKRLKNADAKRKLERKKSIVKYADEQKQAWLKNKERIKKRGINFFLFALLLTGGGAFLTWRRYPPAEEAST